MPPENTELAPDDELEADVTQAIAACEGDMLATVRALVVTNNFLVAQNEVLSAELEQVWQQVSPATRAGRARVE